MQQFFKNLDLNWLMQQGYQEEVSLIKLALKSPTSNYQRLFDTQSIKLDQIVASSVYRVKAYNSFWHYKFRNSPQWGDIAPFRGDKSGFCIGNLESDWGWVIFCPFPHRVIPTSHREEICLVNLLHKVASIWNPLYQSLMIANLPASSHGCCLYHHPQ